MGYDGSSYAPQNSVGSGAELYQESEELHEVEQADQEIGNRLKDEIKRLLLSE